MLQDDAGGVAEHQSGRQHLMRRIVLRECNRAERTDQAGKHEAAPRIQPLPSLGSSDGECAARGAAVVGGLSQPILNMVTMTPAALSPCSKAVPVADAMWNAIRASVQPAIASGTRVWNSMSMSSIRT